MGPQCLILFFTLFVTKQTNGQIDEKVVDNKIQTLPLEDPLEILQLFQNIELEKEIKKIHEENKEIVKRNIQEIKVLKREKSELKHKYENKLDEAEAVNINQNILIRFMKNIMHYNDKKASGCQVAAQGQKEKLDFLEEEKESYQKKDVMNVKNADLQDVIIKRQEREIEILNATVKMQTSLYEDYEKMNKFDIVNNMDNFPVYAQLMTKTMADQSEKIKQMEEYFEDEKEVNENMEQILKDIQNLKLGFTSGKTDWNLLDQYKDIITILDANLKSVLPTLSHASESKDNRRYHFETAEDGTLLEMTHCQCLPQKGESNENVAFSAVELTCPDDTVFSKTLQRTLAVPCALEECLPQIGDVCGNFTEPDWLRYPKGWGPSQCTPLTVLSNSPTLDECKATCFKTEKCTAFNWAHENGPLGYCSFLDCGPSATEPNTTYHADQGYSSFHGFKRDCDCKDCEEPTPGCLERETCELPWVEFENHCYKNITTRGSAACRSSCQAEGADIISIHSHAENEFLSNLVTGPKSLTYLGADCQSGSNKCKWMDGSSWDYSNWASGYPEGTEYCTSLGLVSSGYENEWYDNRVCTYSNADCICKK